MGREGFEPSTLGLRVGLGSLGRFRRVWHEAILPVLPGNRSRLISVGLLPRCCPPVSLSRNAASGRRSASSECEVASVNADLTHVGSQVGFHESAAAWAKRHDRSLALSFVGIVADLLIAKIRAGVATVKPTDPFSSLEIHRINRDAWEATPARPGIYLLYGFVEGEPAVYVGMSSANMRDPIRTHHVTPRKNWFGVLFAIPMASPLLLPAIEAEMIRRVREASVVSIVDNRADEKRWLDVDEFQVTPALDGIVGALEMLLGSDIFTSQEDEPTQVVERIERPPKLARTYKGPAEHPTQREPDDPLDATHRWAGGIVRAWGRFEGPEPDTQFRVLAGSGWRAAILDPSHAVYRQQQHVADKQQSLIEAGVLNVDAATFSKDHVFDNWTRAARTVSGWGSYSGGYHWQLIESPDSVS